MCSNNVSLTLNHLGLCRFQFDTGSCSIRCNRRPWHRDDCIQSNDDDGDNDDDNDVDDDDDDDDDDNNNDEDDDDNDD